MTLSVLSLRAAAVVLDWRRPQAVVKEMIVSVGCQTLLASQPYVQQGKWLSRSAPCLKQVLFFNADSFRDPAALQKTIPIQDLVRGSRGDPLKRDSPPKEVVFEEVSRDTAIVMFTSGSTGTPKAVPVTHAGLLWNCARKLELSPSAFTAPGASTVCFLPNFHVVGFVNNFLFNLCTGARCHMFAACSAPPVTPALLLAACSELRPDVLSTVPWLLQGLAEQCSSSAEAAAILRRCSAVECGGASPGPVVRAQFAQLGVSLANHYGQTELGGMAMMSMLGGPAMECHKLTPVGTVRAFLIDDANSLSDSEGELWLVGHHGTTAGYLNSDKRKALPCISALAAARDNGEPVHCTGDVFRREARGDGTLAYVHCCRQDDLVVLSVGEMPNPIPIEEALMASAAGAHVARLCVMGQQRDQLVAAVELKEAPIETPKAIEIISKEFARINATQAGYAHVEHDRILLLRPWLGDPALPVSMKGNVVRPAAEEVMRDRIDELFARDVGHASQDPTTEPADDWFPHEDVPVSKAAVDTFHIDSQSTEELDDWEALVESGLDSMAIMKRKNQSLQMKKEQSDLLKARAACGGHMYFACMFGVMIAHIDMGTIAYPTKQLRNFTELYSVQGFAACAGLADMQLLFVQGYPQLMQRLGTYIGAWLVFVTTLPAMDEAVLHLTDTPSLHAWMDRDTTRQSVSLNGRSQAICAAQLLFEGLLVAHLLVIILVWVLLLACGMKNVPTLLTSPQFRRGVAYMTCGLYAAWGLFLHFKCWGDLDPDAFCPDIFRRTHSFFPDNVSKDQPDLIQAWQSMGQRFSSFYPCYTAFPTFPAWRPHLISKSTKRGFRRYLNAGGMAAAAAIVIAGGFYYTSGRAPLYIDHQAFGMEEDFAEVMEGALGAGIEDIVEDSYGRQLLRSRRRRKHYGKYEKNGIPVWTFDHMVENGHDLLLCLITIHAVAFLLPSTPTIFSSSGANSLATMLLHVPALRFSLPIHKAANAWFGNMLVIDMVSLTTQQLILSQPWHRHLPNAVRFVFQ
eukprot:gene4259-5243_t